MANITHKRYEFRYGNFYVYDVIKETEKQFVYTQHDEGNAWRPARTIENRKSKDNTFLTVREALENEAAKYRLSIEGLNQRLQSARSSLGQIEAMLKKSDDKLEVAVAEIKRF